MQTDSQRNDEQKSIQHLMTHAGKFPVLTREQEFVLITEAQSGEECRKKAAEKALVDHNLRLIIKLAGRYTGKGLPLEDLVNEGVDGLLYAVSKFKLSTGNKLSTYAVCWIRQKMGRAIANKAKLLRLPTNQLEDAIKLDKAYAKFRVDENRPPTSRELAAILGWEQSKAELLGRLRDDYVSLYIAAGEDNTLPLIDYIVDTNPSTETSVEQRMDCAYVREVLEHLSEEDQKFLKLKYGFLDDKPRTDREMASLYGMPIKEIQRIEEGLLSILSKLIDKDRLSFLED